MIKKLFLNNFGKFRGKKEFELSPVTVFYGENESGKTTVFDGLFYALCKPRRSAKYGGIKLNIRYGDEAAAEVVPPTSLDADEFMNLLAIRAGDIDIEATGNPEWLQKVKASLFSGGIDPLILTARLEELSSNDGRKQINKDIEDFKQRINDRHAEFMTKQKLRESILLRQRDVETMGEELLKDTEGLRQIEQDISNTKKEIEKEDKIRERARLTLQLKKANDCFMLDEQLKRLSAFRTNRIGELGLLEKEYRKFVDEGIRLSERENALKGMESAQSDNLRKAEDKASLLKPKAETAQDYLSRVSLFTPGFIQRTAWNPGMIAGGLVAFVMALLAALFLGDTARLILVAGGTLAAVVLLFLARRVEGIADESSESKFLQPIKEKWGIKFPEDIATMAGWNTLAGFKARLDDFIRQYELAKELAGKAENELRDTKRLSEDINKQVAEIEEDVRLANKMITDWLNEMGVNDRDAYLSKVNEVPVIQKQIRDIEIELQINVNSPAEIKMNCERKLNEFDRDGIPEKGRSEAEYTQLKLRIEKLREEKEVLNQNLKSLEIDKANDTGQIKGSLGDLPQQIRRLEEEIFQLRRNLEDKELDKKAAVLAGKIFEEISKDASIHFEALKNDIRNMLSVIVPDERCVEVKSLDVSKFTMKDAGGKYREVEMLSHGTRDAFVLAARLAMAKKASDGAKLLVLDEPFLHFDNSRAENALKLLNQSFFSNGWQVIFFTKEKELRDLAKETFENAAIYELEVR